MKTPLRYFGGKQLVINKLLPLIPEHNVYVEVFGGGGSLLFAKQPSNFEVFNDLYEEVYNFFKVLQNPKLFGEFYRLAFNTPYSRQYYYECRKIIKEKKANSVERAWAFFECSRQCTSGLLFNSWGHMLSHGRKNPLYNVLIGLPEIHQRLMNVQIENLSFERLIPKYDKKDVFFYLDPPYLLETRKEGKYVCEMSKEQHEQLLNIIVKVKGKVMISGSDSKLYNEKLKEWAKYSWDVPYYCIVRSSRNKKQIIQKRTECVWLNYQKKINNFLSEEKGE